MTTLVVHNLAQPTDCRFLPKNLIQANDFRLSYSNMGVMKKCSVYSEPKKSTLKSKTRLLFFHLSGASHGKSRAERTLIQLLRYLSRLNLGDFFSLFWLGQTVLRKRGHTNKASIMHDMKSVCGGRILQKLIQGGPSMMCFFDVCCPSISKSPEWLVNTRSGNFKILSGQSGN